MNPKLKELTEKYNVVCIMEFGSHLYGTSTEDSDKDYKGIFLPTKEQILLQKIPKHIKADTKTTKERYVKNTKDDIDIELYSFSYFIELCLKGETVGIDMLHCPDNKVIHRNPGCGIWDDIRFYRNYFYTNNLKGFVGYCRKQASKYGIKGSRISSAELVREFLYTYNVNHNRLAILADVWDNLPKGEHINFVLGGKNNDEEFYQVCGKKLQKTSKISYCIDILQKFIDSYGHRALLAKKNEGIDWKAVSHAMRYGLQIKELFETGDIVFPLIKANFISDIKQGKLDYISDVAPKLEKLMDDIEILSNESGLPNKPDRRFWENYILEVYSRIVVRST